MRWFRRAVVEEPHTPSDDERALLKRRQLQDKIVADVSQQFDEIRKRLDEYSPDDPATHPGRPLR